MSDLAALPPVRVDSVPASLIGPLTAAAERILQHAPIGPDDDFFDLGCDSITALALALEAETLTGRAVSPTTIYDAPSVASLAVHLSGVLPRRASVLVLLRPGDPALTPIFMAPGLGSTVMQLAGLARSLQVANPVYGLEPIGLEGNEAPPASIEQMAACYAAEIRALWPEGGCHLLGYCYGGMVALHLASLLSAGLDAAAPPRPTTLTLVNSYPHSRYWPTLSRMRAWLALLGEISPDAVRQRAVQHHLPALRDLPFGQAALHALRLTGRGLMLPLRIFALSAYVREQSDGEAEDRAIDIPASLQRVRDVSAVAFRRFRPGRFAGPNLLITARPLRRLPFDPTDFWRRRLACLTIRHLDCPSPDLLAREIQTVGDIVSAFVGQHPASR